MESPKTSDQEMKDGDNGWTEVQEPAEDKQNKEEVTPDETIQESTVGNGLGGKETKRGGRKMRKKKNRIIRRPLTLKEACRVFNIVCNCKIPRKMKQENCTRQYQEEQMKTADAPSFSVSRMREAQAKLQTPYLVLSGNVKPGQTSDPISGFAAVEKDFAGGLTPMLGDKKVEHFLNIKRKAEPGYSPSQKKL